MAAYLGSAPYHQEFSRKPREDLDYRNNGNNIRNGDADGGPPPTFFDRLRMHIFASGPNDVIHFAGCLADESDDRFLDQLQFRNAIETYLRDRELQPSLDEIDGLFSSFLQYGSTKMSYDDFLHEIKCGFSPERKDVVRAAFRRLDRNAEGLVDFNYMMSCYNAGRHPLCGKIGDAASLTQDFATSMEDFLSFRRGRRVNYGGTNYVAWEEFEDFYLLINGCFDDELFCTCAIRCWDIDKEMEGIPAHEVEKTSAAPAAGIPPKSRVGLHHWQPNTLPASDTFRCKDIQLDRVFDRLRQAVAHNGVRHAFSVVENFISADDNVDDMVDLREFRKAARQSSIRVNDDEVDQIFKDMGTDVVQTNGMTVRLLPVFVFLERLHGTMSPQRRQIVEKAWHSFGRETVPPMELKRRFDPEGHPLVARGQAEPQQIAVEFMDTFSLLMQIINGTKDGEVIFTGFAAYYRILSSTIPPEQDAYFDMLVSRVWGLDGGGIDKHLSPRCKSPMADRRPPPVDGPSAYAMDEKDCHRRYIRSDSPCKDVHENFHGPDPTPPANLQKTPITKSNIIFDDPSKPGLREIAKRLALNIARRGLKGWALFVRSLQKYDDLKNGQIHKQAFERLTKTLGLGLSPEEKDDLMKCLLTKTGALDYVSLIAGVKGEMSPERQARTMNLFHRIKQNTDRVLIADLHKRFIPQAYPTVVLGKKSLQEATLDFEEGLSLYSQGVESLDICAFFEFFSAVNAVFPADDEFRLMSSSIFGFDDY